MSTSTLADPTPETDVAESFADFIASRPPQPAVRDAGYDPSPRFKELEGSLLRRMYNRRAADLENTLTWRRYIEDAENIEKKAANHRAEAEVAAALIIRHSPFAATSTYDADALERAKRAEQDALAAASQAKKEADDLRARADAVQARGQNAYRHYAAAVQDRRVVLLDPDNPHDAALWADKGFRTTWVRLAEAGYLSLGPAETTAIAPAAK